MNALHTQLAFTLAALTLASLVAVSRALAADVFEAQLNVRADAPGGTIRPAIYGQFAEHLGRGIEDGIWVGEESPIPNTRGIRNDMIAAMKELGVPVLRWPGGCFADEYHWRDGTGPREKRPKRINTTWGGVVESNQFGTHEFMDFCELIGADAYVCGNLGSGSPQEMAQWIEYMTSDSDSSLANERRTNGRDKPWKLKYFAVGNESWGCGGSMRPEFYADEFRRYATFIKSYSGNRIEKLACGPNSDDYNWTELLMSRAGAHMNGLSLHYYTLPTGDWKHKGSATGFGEDQWHSTLRRTLHMEELLTRHSAIMDKHDPHKRVGLVVDEWGTWYDPAPRNTSGGNSSGILYQQNTLRDALVAAINLNLFHAHCDRVSMCNIAQLANVLQAMVLTDKEKMILTPTYHVMRMYRVHQGATYLPVDVQTPPYTFGGDASVPGIHVSASRDNEGRLHLSIVNLDPNRSAALSVKTSGASPQTATGTVLTAGKMNAMNTFEAPQTVKPAPADALRLDNGVLSFTAPAKSVTVIEMK